MDQQNTLLYRLAQVEGVIYRREVVGNPHYGLMVGKVVSLA
jgi:hypothetical protein